MNTQEISSSQIEVVIPETPEGIDSKHQQRSELAKTFQEEAIKLCSQIKNSLSEGRGLDTANEVRAFAGLAEQFSAQPLLSLVQQALEMVEHEAWTPLLKELLPKIETALQGTVDLLRQEDLLTGTVRLPEPTVVEKSC